ACVIPPLGLRTSCTRVPSVPIRSIGKRSEYPSISGSCQVSSITPIFGIARFAVISHDYCRSFAPCAGTQRPSNRLRVQGQRGGDQALCGNIGSSGADRRSDPRIVVLDATAQQIVELRSAPNSSRSRAETDIVS